MRGQQEEEDYEVVRGREKKGKTWTKERTRKEEK